MTAYPPCYDELYVISDLHMGGRIKDGHSFQIFKNGPRLAAFIGHVAEQRPDDNVALVLNGDVFDSLAEDAISSYVALDAGSATSMMNHLYEDPSFKPVWDALAAFIQKPNRYLAILMGNHDIEVALPVVEESIRNRLADRPRDQSRIHFATHGGGYACLVGRARVFCTHGNELDPWNFVDYSALGQLANAMNAGRSISPSRWKPNAGTRLVVDVMNHVKRRFPFVDLLKPEVAAVAGVLMMLDRDIFKNIDLRSAFPILRGKRHGSKVTGNLLGAEYTELYSDSLSDASPEALAQELLGPNLQGAIEQLGHGASEDDLLQSVEQARAGGAPIATTEIGETETLGAWDMIKGRIGLVSKEEGLRQALKDWLENDRTFEVHDPEDDLYRQMEDRVADSVDFVVTGHTHKPRAMTYAGGCHYYNSGTWIRTLRLTNEILDDEEAFKTTLWPALMAGRMSTLDELQIPGPDGNDVPLLYDRSNAVRIRTDETQVVGELLRVTDAAGGGVELNPEEGSNPFHAR